MKKIRISAVSYTNTKPFIYGLLHYKDLSEQIELTLDIPSVCAQKLIDQEADLSLIPVAGLLQLSDYHIISDFCIGSVGAVESVFLFSSVPVNEIKTLRLDVQSRTSNNLAMVLLRYYWGQEYRLTEQMDADAYVEIGDRTFGKKNSLPFVYDLGEAWMHFTKLPFAYATWTANKRLSSSFVELFNEGLQYGLDHRREIVKSIPFRSDFDVENYLMQALDFKLDNEKRQAIQLFHEYILQLNKENSSSRKTHVHPSKF